MERVKKCAKVYLSCNVKMEFFRIEGCEGIRIKIIDLTTGRCITLWNDEVYRLIRQLAAYEAVNVDHPHTWKEFLSQAFSLKRYFNPSKYILMTKYFERIILDRQAVATLVRMQHSFKDSIAAFIPQHVVDCNYKRYFRV
jgi:hypothetical protein